MDNTITNKIHISNIVAGDTVEHRGEIKTVTEKDIKQGFCGKTIFGDSYNSGRQLVKRIKFVVPTNKVIRYE